MPSGEAESLRRSGYLFPANDPDATRFGQSVPGPALLDPIARSEVQNWRNRVLAVLSYPTAKYLRIGRGSSPALRHLLTAGDLHDPRTVAFAVVRL